MSTPSAPSTPSSEILGKIRHHITPSPATPDTPLLDCYEQTNDSGLTQERGSLSKPMLALPVDSFAKKAIRNVYPL